MNAPETALEPPMSDGAEARWLRASVLVVDDEPGMRHFLERLLAPRVAQVESAETAEHAQASLDRHRFDLIVLDLALPGQSGLEWLRQLRAQGYSGEVILITAFADLESAIEALRMGAGDFLLKPFRTAQILSAMDRALERAVLRRENYVLRRSLAQRAPTPGALVGSSVVIRGLQAALARLATVDSTVLLTGESGTGKELAAHALHEGSRRARAPFVPVNCAALSAGSLDVELFGRAGTASEPGRDGLFLYAQGGTLFLDEIGDLPLAQQAALLRVLEERRVRPVGGAQDVPVDVRVLAATHRPLAEDVTSGRFRRDLYYRLQVVELHLPPLRSHREDIPELVHHFIGVLAPRLGLPPIAVDPADVLELQRYPWPGNVRELRNFIERSIILGALNLNGLHHRVLPEAPTTPAVATSAPMPVEPEQAAVTDLQTVERRHIEQVLARVGGDKSRAAELLGVSRRTLERRVAEWTADADRG